jgi:hypothetical protein
MTGKKPTAKDEARKRVAVETLRARALGRFGQAIFSACAEYEQGLQSLAGKGDFSDVKIRDVPFGEDERRAFAVAGWLGNAFLTDRDQGRFDLEYDERETLSRLYAALRPAEDPKFHAVELAETLVREHAELAGQYNGGEPHPNLPAPFTVAVPAIALIHALREQVHPAFRALQERAIDVAALLSRYTPTRGFKTKTGEPTKLTAAGILEELNEWAGFRDDKGVYDRPLGVALSAGGISNAVKKKRNTSPRK